MILRPTCWADGTTTLDPDDYEVIYGDQAIGRIYRSGSAAGIFWMWCIYVGHELHGRCNNGIADTLEEAKAAWMRGWQGDD